MTDKLDIKKPVKKTIATSVNKDVHYLEFLHDYKKTLCNPLAGLRKLYLLSVKEKPGLIKVGDTTRSVGVRNEETCTNASLHRTNEVTFWVSKKDDGTWFRDYEVHAFLESKGYKREDNDQGNQSEWFYITEEQFRVEFTKFIGKKLFNTLEIRPVQQYGLSLLAEATAAGCTKINFGSCMRSGKTIISLEHAKRNNCMPIYIGKNLTSQSSAKSDNEEYGIVEYMTTVSIHGQDEDATSELTKKAQRVIAEINEANTQNQQIILYIDECDDASWTEKSRSIITQVANYLYIKGILFQVIPMTGTRKERGMKILNDLSFMSGNSKDMSIEYWEMQILQPDDTVHRNFVTISYFKEYAAGLVNISDAIKDYDVGHASLSTFANLLLSGHNNFQLKDTSEYNAPHHFWKFCIGGKGNGSDGHKGQINKFAKYLNDTLSVIDTKEYLFQPVNGDFTSSDKAQKFCKEVIKANHGKIVVFISFGMATTSFSVSTIGTSVIFSDNTLGADDVQAAHRSATYHDGKEWCNMVHVTTSETTDLSLNDIYEAELPIGPPAMKLPIFKEILNHNSLIHVSVNGENSVIPCVMQHSAAEQILDKRAKERTGVNSMIQQLINDLSVDTKTIISLTIDPKTGKFKAPRKSDTDKGKTLDLFGLKADKKKTAKKSGMTEKTQEKIFRAFVENVVYVAAFARLTNIELSEFNHWNEINVNEDLYKLVCAESVEFAETIDQIYRMCEDESYLVKSYIDKLAA